MAKKWLVDRWNNEFFVALDVCTTEEEVKHACECELEAWRSRGLSDNSMRVPVTDTRNEILARYAEKPEQQELQAWALEHLNLSEAKWAEINAPSVKAQAKRLENQQFIQSPDEIVSRAVALLDSSRWQEVCLGLLVLTGRRLSEVLKTGEFEPCTGFSVLFSGQLKKRGEDFPAYEIPTLCEAEKVLAGVARLRSMRNLENMAVELVNTRHPRPVAVVAKKHFSDLVPTLDGKDLHAHVFRTVYTRIAVLYYCPLQVADLHFLATTQGHFELTDKNEIQRNYGSEMNYNHYKLVNEDGQIDGRQGIKLGLPGVDVLQVFKSSFNGVAPRQAAKNGTVAPERQSANSEVLHAVVLTPENLLPADVAELVLVAMDSSHNDDFMAFLIEACRKEARFRLGVATRYAGRDFKQMSTEDLMKVKHPDALNERIARAVNAIDEHNGKVGPLERWFINPTSVQGLINGRFNNIAAYFLAHQEEIDALNAKYELSAKYNRKPLKISECIKLD